MSRTNQILGKHLVERINQLCEFPHARMYVKKKLMTLKTEDRDEYLGYLEDMKLNQEKDEEEL